MYLVCILYICAGYAFGLNQIFFFNMAWCGSMDLLLTWLEDGIFTEKYRFSDNAWIAYLFVCRHAAFFSAAFVLLCFLFIFWIVKQNFKKHSWVYCFVLACILFNMCLIGWLLGYSYGIRVVQLYLDTFCSRYADSITRWVWWWYEIYCALDNQFGKAVLYVLYMTLHFYWTRFLNWLRTWFK